MGYLYPTRASPVAEQDRCKRQFRTTVYTTRQPTETPAERSDFIPSADSTSAQTTDALLMHRMDQKKRDRL